MCKRNTGRKEIGPCWKVIHKRANERTRGRGNLDNL